MGVKLHVGDFEMVWDNRMQRTISQRMSLAIFIVNTVRNNKYLYQSLSKPIQATHGIVMLETAKNASGYATLKSSDGKKDTKHPLALVEHRSDFVKYADYQIYCTQLFQEKDNHKLFLFAKDDEWQLRTVLEKFLNTMMVRLVLTEMLGYVILVDTQYYDVPEIKGKIHVEGQAHEDMTWPAVQGYFGIDAARPEVDILRSLAPDAPFVIAALNLDRPNAMPIERLRSELGLEKTVPILPCEVTHSASVHQVLLALLEQHEVFYGKNAHADLARELIQLYKDNA
jgi:hypothetical protein